MVCLVWLAAAACALPKYLYRKLAYHTYQNREEVICHIDRDKFDRKTVEMISLWFFYALPLIVMSVCVTTKIVPIITVENLIVNCIFALVIPNYFRVSLEMIRSDYGEMEQTLS